MVFKIETHGSMGSIQQKGWEIDKNIYFDISTTAIFLTN